MRLARQENKEKPHPRARARRMARRCRLKKPTDETCAHETTVLGGELESDRQPASPSRCRQLQLSEQMMTDEVTTGTYMADSIRAQLLMKPSPCSVQAHSSDQVLCTITNPSRPPGTVKHEEEDDVSILRNSIMELSKDAMRSSSSTPAQDLVYGLDKSPLQGMYDKDTILVLADMAVVRVTTFLGSPWRPLQFS